MSEALSFPVARGTRALTRQRLLIRRAGAGWPFVWRGLLPLLGLLAVFLYAVWPFARQEIEANVRRSVTQAFVEKGLTGVDISVSGQQVLLTGQLRPGVNTLDALALARAATCQTWLGPQPCAEMVIGQFESVAQVPAAPSLPAAPAVTSAAPSVEQQEACEKALAAIVERQHIEFRTGSAHLSDASAGVFDEIAKAHAGCQGTVRIEGHTDNLGGAESNRRLSLARANAVRDALIARGVPADRLVAEGLGETQPIADNATVEGRQQNRRIDFKVVVPN